MIPNFLSKAPEKPKNDCDKTHNGLTKAQKRRSEGGPTHTLLFAAWVAEEFSNQLHRFQSRFRSLDKQPYNSISLLLVALVSLQKRPLFRGRKTDPNSAKRERAAHSTVSPPPFKIWRRFVDPRFGAAVDLWIIEAACLKARGRALRRHKPQKRDTAFKRQKAQTTDRAPKGDKAQKGHSPERGQSHGFQRFWF